MHPKIMLCTGFKGLKNNILKFSFSFLFFLLTGVSFSQVNITPIRTDVTGFGTWTDAGVAGTTYLQLLTATSSTISPAMDFDVYTSETLDFKVRTFGGTTPAEIVLTVWISTDNGATYTSLGTRTPASTTLTAVAQFDISGYSGTQVKIKFTVAGTSDLIGVGIDDISIRGIAATCVSPTTQATSFSTNAITATSMNIAFTRGNGTAGVLVVARAAGAVNADPVSGTTYTASSTFGSGTQIGTGNYVVYNGTANGTGAASGNISITGLTSNTAYHFAVYEYNTLDNCFHLVQLVGNATTLCAAATEPTTNATGISHTPSCTSVLINFTRSTTATNSVIVFSTDDCSGGSFTDLADQNAYTANTVYGSGELVGANERVVFNGTGNTVTVTGLTNGVTYYYKIYSYNGTTADCNENYLLSAACNSFVAGPTTEPTTNATLISHTTTCNSATINFTRSTTATNSMIVVSTDDCSGVNFTDPSDQTTYTANAAYGSGTLIGTNERVVFRGTGNTVTVTNLLANTTYYYKIYSFNGTTANCNENYLLSASCGTFTITTATEPTTNATGISETVLCDRATINFTRSTTATNSIIVLSTDDCSGVNFTDVSDQTNYTANAAYGSGTLVGTNERVVYKGTGNTVNVTNLLPNTTYYYKIYSYNGTTANCNENYLLSASCRSFTTPASCGTPQISLILVNSCSGNANEGVDEFVVIENGIDPLSLNDMTINFPSGDNFCNSGCGTNTFTNNATHIAALNTAAGCTLFQFADPIPANANIVVFTGLNPTSVVNFVASCPGPYYAVFCNNATTSGRFGNTGGDRTLTIDFGTSTDAVTYTASAVNTGVDGDFASFTAAGTCSYGNSATCSALLPMELTYLSANCSENKLNVFWETASERNNDYFTLEYSLDGINYEEIAKIDGAGSSSTSQNYSVETSVRKGYLRLKQTDFNGEFSYSETILIHCQLDEILIYPNPTNGKLNIDGENIDEIFVYNQLGQIVAQYKELNVIDLSQFSSGIYNLKVIQNNVSKYFKVNLNH